jgi:hypothetical protein
METFRTSIVQLFLLSLILLRINHCSDTANSINYFGILFVSSFFLHFNSKQSNELLHKSEFFAILRQILLWDKFHSFNSAPELSLFIETF